jgi:peptide/nickel transport system substrate-binding protein
MQGHAKRRGRMLALGLAALALAGIGASSASATPAHRQAAQTTQRKDAGTTLVIGVASDPQTLDPEYGQATRANELIKNIYAQWVHYAPIHTAGTDMKANLKNVVGEALASYSQTPDGTVTLKLRPGIKSAQGNPLTADDMVYKIQRALGLNAGSVFDFNILGLTKPDQVTKVDNETIKIKLPTASPILGPMLRDQDAGLLDSTVLKQHVANDDWGHAWLAQTGGAATGAYSITQNVPGQKIVLSANPNYWGPKPYFQTVVLQVVPSAQTRILLLENGSIDIAEDLSTNDVLKLKGKQGIRIATAPTVDQDMLGFLENKKPFNNKLVRQAVAYAVPYKQLVSGVLKGEAKVSKGVWPENSIWFDKRAPWPYKTNIAKAKQLLAKAGYKNGLSFTVEISTGDADAQALAVPLQTSLKAAGITMNIKALSAAQYQSDLGKHTAQAWIGTNLGSYVDDPYYQTFLWFGTKSVLNWFQVSIPSVDSALKQFATVLAPAKKKALVLGVQKALNANLPMVSLGEPNFVMAMRSDIGGFLYEPDGLLTYRLLTRTSG